MGKHLWRKHPYVRVEDDHPGCIWTVFRMLNYHPWHNVRKMLPYKKHKSQDNSTKSRGIRPEEEHEFSHILLLEEDTSIKHSASINSGSSRNGSASKRSIKARIKALIREKNNSAELDLQIQEPEFQEHKDKCDGDDCAPTLMSLLKANPKLIKSIKHVDKSSNIKAGTRVKHKDSKEEDDYVGVLELFKVDRDLFSRILQDSPHGKPKLVKAETFPFQNPCNHDRRPTKVEHKYNEAWPLSSKVRELRKVKSQGMTRSLSFTEYSLDKYGYLFDNNSNKAIKKHLSKSLRLTNEKEFELLGDIQGRRSFKERLYSSESESHSFTTSYGEVRVLRLDSLREIESSGESLSDEKENSFIVEERQSNEEQIDAMTSTRETNLQVCYQEDEIENVDCSTTEDSQLVSHSAPTISENLEDTQDSNDDFLVEYYNEDLQYVKYVLDIVGLDKGEEQLEEWHSQNQPLDPALFDGIEVCCPFEPKSTSKDAICMSSSHRKLVFDLINEALVDINKLSYVYYPKALSFWCHVCLMTNGNDNGVGEVWEFIREYLSWRPELDPLLDLAVAHDLSKDKNGWVNLQKEIEGLALELEELIFDELLEEIVCC